MVRSTASSKPAMQIVLQGEARHLRQHMELRNIAFQVLDRPGPLTMRVAVADWSAIRDIAAEDGYARPDFYSQSDSAAAGAFKGHGLRPKKPAGTR